MRLSRLIPLALLIDLISPASTLGATSVVTVDNSAGNVIASGAVVKSDPNAALVTVTNGYHFWVAADLQPAVGGASLRPASLFEDVGGLFAAGGLIAPSGTAAWDGKFDIATGGSQAVRLHYELTSAGGAAALAANLLTIIADSLGASTSVATPASLMKALTLVTDLPNFVDLVHAVQRGDLWDFVSTVEVLLQSGTGRATLREALSGVGVVASDERLLQARSVVGVIDWAWTLIDMMRSSLGDHFDGTVTFAVAGPSKPIVAPKQPIATGKWPWTSAGQTPYVFDATYYQPAAVFTVLRDGRAMLVGLPGSGQYKDGTSPRGPVVFSGEIYDPTGNTWMRTAPTPPLEQADYLLPTDQGALLVGSTASSDGGDEPVALSYDSSSDSWSPTAAPPTSPSATPAGYTDPKTGDKALLPGLGKGWMLSAARANPDGHVAALFTSSEGGWQQGVAVFDPVSRSWGPLHSFAAPVCSTDLLLASGYVLVVGGGDQPSDGNDCVEVQANAKALMVDTATGDLSSTGPMATPRIDPYVIELQDGRVLVVAGLKGAGVPDDNGIVDTAEIYGPPQ